jgi:hypothetical protein
MSALTPSSIPSHINTYERLAVYAIQALASCANGLEVNVQANAQSQPLVQCAIQTTADNVPRFILSAYIPLDLNMVNDPTEKTWMAAKDVSAAAPHTVFGSN